MDGPVPAPLPLPSGANGRPGFTSPMSKEKSAEHTPLMKHHYRLFIFERESLAGQGPDSQANTLT